MSLEELEPGAMPDGDPRLNRMLALLESMDARMSRLEGQVAELTTAAPAVVASVTDTIDGAITKAAERGIDVDARLHASLSLVESLTEPRTVEVVGRLVDRIELVDQGLTVLQQVPDLTAGAVDTVDRLVAAAAASGIDIDLRLRASLALAERLTDPDTVEALLALTDRASDAAQAVELMGQAPGMVAGAMDTVDGVMASLAARGVDVDARARALLHATEKLTEPAVLSTLTRLAEQAPMLEEALQLAEQLPGVAAGALDTVDGIIGKLQARGVDLDARMNGLLRVTEAATHPRALAAVERLLANPEALEQLASIAEQAPGVVASALDTFDSLVARLAEQGIDVNQRVVLLVKALDSLTDPTIIRLLQTVTARSSELSHLVDVLMSSGLLGREAAEVVGATGTAVLQTRAARPPSVGAFGALAAIFDPDVQRSLGFAISFARTFGQQLPH